MEASRETARGKLETPRRSEARASGEGLPTAPPPVTAAFLLGTLLLLIAFLSACYLAAHHIWSVRLPGCGPGSGCDAIANGRWGRLWGIPVSYWGAAYFAALLPIWLNSARRGPQQWLRVAAWAGALGSLAFVALMVSEGRFCLYCAAVHAANFLWVGVVERAVRRAPVRRGFEGWPAAVSACVFLLVMIGGRHFELEQSFAKQEEAIKNIAGIGAPKDVAGDNEIAASAEAPPYGGAPGPSGQSVAANASTPSHAADSPPSSDSAASPSATDGASAPVESPVSPPASRLFTGRYRLGPPDADVRIVAFQDYRCELCRKVETEFMNLMAQRNDLSISVKQFPFDTECNPQMIGKTVHPGACKAARAAEAIGILGGDDAFWKIHGWLFERGGLFTDFQIEEQVRNLGLDIGRFKELINSTAVTENIASDCREAAQYGLTYTPMIFVNGYQVSGWDSPGVLAAAIERAAQMARQHARQNDEPIRAVETRFKQWLYTQPEDLPVRPDDHVRGPEDAPATVLVFGDLTCIYNAVAHSILQDAIAKHPNARLVFRNFPLDADCNDLVKQVINPFACEAARVAEAANLLGGADAYWSMRDWIIAHRQTYTAASLAQAAAELKLDASALDKTKQDPRAAQRIHDDIEEAKGLNINKSPTIFINGKHVEVWRTPGLIEKILGSLDAPQTSE